MGEKTHRNLYEAFVGEAKAHFRLLAYAEKAEDKEGGNNGLDNISERDD